MKDRRNSRRWNLLLFVPVWDTNSNNILGYIADISEDGILVFSAKPFELNKTFSMTIRLQDLKRAFIDQNITNERILFHVESRWVDIEVKPFFNRTGFAFVNLSDDASNTIYNITRNLANNLAWNKVPS